MTNTSSNTIAVQDCGPALDVMREDILRGLAARPKYFPSQYLYDERGAQLFEDICATQEYYPTRTEVAILETHMEAIVSRVGPDALVIEPGSGSGVKTCLLLSNLESPAGYAPIDVAREQLVEFAAKIEGRFPDLAVLPVCADFSNGYEIPRCANRVGRRVVFFPGSTIGNFTPSDAVDILRHMKRLCGPGGGILIGVDLKKGRDVLEPAYDDQAGASAEFATNILVRLNRELDADFDLSLFSYEAPYNEALGRIEMALVSLTTQVVHIGGVDVHFSAGERARTEYSYKYTEGEFAALARRAGLQVCDAWTDSRRWFSVQYLEPVDQPEL